MARFVSELDIVVHDSNSMTMDVIDSNYTCLTHAVVQHVDMVVRPKEYRFSLDLCALVRIMKMPGYHTLEMKMVNEKPGILTVTMSGQERHSEYDLATFIPVLPTVVTLEGMRHVDSNDRIMSWSVHMLTSTLRDTVVSMIACKTGMFSVECMPEMNGSIVICGEGSYVRSRSVIEIRDSSKGAWGLTIGDLRAPNKYPLAPLAQILKDSRPNDVIVIGICRTLFVIDIFVPGVGAITQYIAPATMN
jgi:hypothetical protein